MAKISTEFYENVIDGDSVMWDGVRSKPETTTQCLAAIVILLAELVDSINENAQTASVREIYKGADVPHKS